MQPVAHDRARPVDGSPALVRAIGAGAHALALALALLALEALARLVEGHQPPGTRTLLAGVALGTVLSGLAHRATAVPAIAARRVVAFGALVASARAVLCVARTLGGARASDPWPSQWVADTLGIRSASHVAGVIAMALLLGGSMGLVLARGRRLTDAAAPTTERPAGLEAALWGGALSLIFAAIGAVWPLAGTPLHRTPAIAAGLGLALVAAALELERRRLQWLRSVRAGDVEGWGLVTDDTTSAQGPAALPSFVARERLPPLSFRAGAVLVQRARAGAGAYRSATTLRAVARVPGAVHGLVARRRWCGVMLAVAAGVTLAAASSGAPLSPTARALRHEALFDAGDEIHIDAVAGYSADVQMTRVWAASVGAQPCPRVVVGVDARGGILRGPELFRRIHAAPPEVLARAAIEILLDCQGAPLLGPVPSPPIDAPRVEAGQLVFYTHALQPGAARLQRHEVELETGSILSTVVAPVVPTQR